MKNLLFKVIPMALIMLLGVHACKEKKESDQYNGVGNEADLSAFAITDPVNSKLPSDVMPSCVVSDSLIKSWFASGSVSKNGAVNPANSLTAVHNVNCDFYKWSEQMFLWITSPNTSGDYKDGTVMESPSFYTVSTSQNSMRTLIPHEKGKLITAEANTQKTDSRIIDSEEAQATDDVLLAQNDSLVYYISMVNDVYAKFLEFEATQTTGASQFPTTQSALDSIVNYAESKGQTVKDPNTLTMEIKTSWVDTTNLKDVDSYITMKAIVPTYDTTNNKTWTPKGTTEKTLALVGIHIVGTIDGHPEMVWATFEHVNNAPNLSYEYINTDNDTITVAADTGNDWLLNGDSASGTYNQSHMQYCNSSKLADSACDVLNSIYAKDNFTISPSNTKMTKPWGVANDGVPNPENATPAASNTQVISTNNSVLSWLADDDMRKNYIFIGATWTDGGAPPDATSYSATNTKPGVAIGTSQLANSTMETYAQNGASYSTYGSCFSCHSSPSLPYGVTPPDLSHIYSELLDGEKAKNTSN